MCAGVTHAIMMHLFLFTSRRLSRTVFSPGPQCAFACVLLPRSAANDLSTRGGCTDGSYVVLPASKEGMERESEGDDCHIVGPRSLCGLWFWCATQWQ